MIVAELNGKMPSNLKDSEDILTSDVFSFFKYADRRFLVDYLQNLGVSVSIEDAQKAEFVFWPTYEDGTEPDLVILCGNYYLLFEAKLYSDFSPKTKSTEAQIDREVKMGKMAAQNINKDFVFIAITAEYYKDRDKYFKYENNGSQFIWTNWQSVAAFLYEKLFEENIQNSRGFADDLYLLLVKKRLRAYRGISNIKVRKKTGVFKAVFYNVKSSKYKGEFTGYLDSLESFKLITSYRKFYRKQFFSFPGAVINNREIIFYNG